MFSRNETVNKGLGIAICVMVALDMLLFSCSPKTERQILGVWEVVNSSELAETGDIWAFRPDNTFQITDTYGSVSGMYVAENNAVFLQGKGNLYDAMIMNYNGEFSIVDISKKKMTLSGTIKYIEYFDGSYYSDTYSGTILLER